MILLVSDVHARYALINAQIEHAEARFGRPVTSVIVLGDFGLFSRPLHKYFVTDGQRFCRPVYFVEGNHEDFVNFKALTTTWREQFTHLPRGEVRVIDGYRFLAFGGASYMNPKLTPASSVIRDTDIDRCLKLPADGVDFIVSHDCPEGLAITDSPQFSHLGPPGFKRGFELSRHFHPALWIFGHHHQWHSSTHDGTRFEGLAEVWHGYAVIKKKRRFSAIEHPIKQRPGLLQRLLPGLFG